MQNVSIANVAIETSLFAQMKNYWKMKYRNLKKSQKAAYPTTLVHKLYWKKKSQNVYSEQKVKLISQTPYHLAEE